MKLSFAALSLFLVFWPSCIFAELINGFDGYKWGTSREEIVSHKGEEGVIWGDFLVWEAENGGTVNNFTIALIGYQFHGGCNEIKPAKSDPCSLWGGAYILETTSESDIKIVYELLNNKYGTDRKIEKIEEKRHPSTGRLLSRINISRHIWQQKDRSAIELFYKSHDRDHIEGLNQVKKGIYRVGIRYYSPANMESRDVPEINLRFF